MNILATITIITALIAGAVQSGAITDLQADNMKQEFNGLLASSDGLENKYNTMLSIDIIENNELKEVLANSNTEIPSTNLEEVDNKINSFMKKSNGFYSSLDGMLDRAY